MRLSSSVILGTCLISSSAALAGGEWEILISSLDPTVPGVPDAVWVPNTFNVPTIDENGNIAFRGQIGGADITLANSRLVLRGSPGNWSILAREGSPLPGDVIPGYVFNQTTGLNGLSSSTSMSANGGVIVSGFVNGPDVASTTDTAAVYVPADDLTTPYLIGREGDAYPGGGGAVMSSSFSLSITRVTNDGACLLSTSLTGGDVSGSTNNSALVLFTRDGALPVHRKGSPAPGFTDDTILNQDAFGYYINGDLVAFSGTLVGSTITTSDDKAAFTNFEAAKGELRMYWREGDPVPGMPGVIYRPSASLVTPSQPLNAGGLYFFAEMEGEGVTAGVDNRAVFRQSGGSQEILMRQNDPIPGLDPKVARFWTFNTTSWTITPSGGIAFQALMQAPDGSNLNTAYLGYRCPIGELSTICVQGDPVPGMADGVFGSLNGSSSITASDSGIVVFSNSVVTSSGNVATVFAWDKTEGLRIIAQAGDTQFTGTPCNQLSLSGSTGQNGEGGSTNISPSGWLAMRANDTVNQIYTIARINLGAAAPACPGDFNDDGIVDGADLAVLLGSWGECPPKGACPADLNGDGIVDGADLAILLGSWGPCIQGDPFVC